MSTALTKEIIITLSRINGAHPLVLAADIETRRVLEDVLRRGIYKIQPAARKAIEDALVESESGSVPITPVSDFSAVAYCDEEDTLECIRGVTTEDMKFTAGKRYPLTTATYKFTDTFTRTKVHFNEETRQTYTKTHDCTLSGQDRYIQVVDDRGQVKRFMDRPRKTHKGMEFEESSLWNIFKKPVVKTVREVCADVIKQNEAVLRSCEMLSGYTYYPGQTPYLASVAVKNYGLVAGATGTGKTLMAISLLAMKGPNRALIIAPQGTMRSSESDDDEDGQEYNASQWVTEMHRFAPYLQVWELFSYEDYQRICSVNGGELPPGVYITYFQALLHNGARESAPDSWDDKKLEKMFDCKLPDFEGKKKNHWCETIGREEDGIRCIIEPCLATKIGHLFDMVLLDEAHYCANLESITTQMLIRMQPKYRYALTASPIPNVISNIFSLMGWLAVPDWYKGERRNAAWPYAREDLSRFNDTFLSEERDVTQEEINRRRDKNWRGTCVKASPVISSPARLLKLLKPTLAYISKEEANPGYKPPKIVDIRVPMGLDQAKLYAHYLDRANVPGNHPLVRARRQTAWLRSICADPANFRHGNKQTPKVVSNMNPKLIAILELVRDMLKEGEQVVIINSRVGLSSAIQEKLVEAGVSIARIDSTITADQHAFQSNLFKSGKARVMLMGIRCAASHSFSQCKYEIIGSIEYSPGPLDQAKGRVDRVNSRPGVTIYCILCQLSVEEVQFETSSVKGDAATICLRGQRVPRTFKPVDASEVLATAIERFDLSGSAPEMECEKQWPKLRALLKTAVDTSKPLS